MLVFGNLNELMIDTPPSPKLIYCATPSRISDKITDTMDYVTEQGHAPLHPFQALPYERFEGNPRIGREPSMKWCMQLIDICDIFQMFGVSDGTLQELTYAIGIDKPIVIQFEGFDPEWKKFYTKLAQKHGNPLQRIIGGYYDGHASVDLDTDKEYNLRHNLRVM